MNLMGKIFTLLIFFMSITFLVLAVMVGASHRNWKEIAAANKDKATLAADRLEQAQSASSEFKRKLNAEQVSRTHQFAQLYSAKAVAEKKFNKQVEAFTKLSAESAGSVVQVETANNLLMARDETINDLKNANRSLTENVATQRQSVVSLTTEVFNLKGQVRALEQSSQDLSSLVAQQARVLKANGKSITDPTDEIPRSLEGLVTRQSDGFIAVSLGTDDGLRVGHSLDVYRADRYVGRATVTRTEHNISAARLLPEYERALVQEGDYVTTEL